MSSKDLAISVRDLSKRYTLVHRGGGAEMGRRGNPFRRTEREAFWALRDVDFTVGRGEVMGIIGRNGAGKSTLLKILSRITAPTTGRIEIYGRVGSLLEVGTGFHPELTGRENVYLNGAILGMNRREIDRKFDEIVDFAGVEKFLDTPVKRYSSGMYVRLAFGVAAHLHPEILIVDEVLAVGDAAFQKKCLGKMQDVAGEGRTVLFVSHNMGSMRQLCSRGIWMSGGQVAAEGTIDECIGHYLTNLHQELDRNTVRGASGLSESDHLRLSRVVLKNRSGEPTTTFHPGEDLVVEVHYHAPRRIYNPHLWIAITSQFGALFQASMLLDGHTPDYIEGEGILGCTFHALPLLPQDFILSVGARAGDGVTPLLPVQEVGMFSVVGRLSDYGFQGERADSLSGNSSPSMHPYEWRLPDGRTIRVNGFEKKGSLV